MEGDFIMENLISFKPLTTGESVALGVVEITSIPHISIIDSRSKDDDIVERYKNEMNGLLAEVHQIYKDVSVKDQVYKDIALELMWTTHEVKNQPYNAEIKLFIIVRSIDANVEKAKGLVSSLLRVFKTTLHSQRYETKERSYDDISPIISNVNDNSITAIVKDEKVSNLQNAALPYCYSFDKISSSNNFSKIVGSLINYPNCAVSFQLMPVTYTAQESTELDRVTQVLDTLSHGVIEHGFGHVSYTLAKEHSETYRYYSSHKTMPLYLFNTLIYGNQEAATHIATQLSGFIANSVEQTASLKLVSLQKSEVNKDNNFYPLPWAINEVLMQIEHRNSQLWNSSQFSNAFYRLPYIIGGDEAASFFRLPIGSINITAGLQINQSSTGEKKYTDNIINSGDIIVGKLRSSSNGDTIGFSLKDLAKHMLIVGTPGSGKTTFSVSLLDRLWKEHHIPFLVIEPAKNEYRALVQSIPELQVFTPGKNFISPFVFNPFVPPKNVKLETYKSTLKTAFAAAVSMSTPLDKIFEESINNCYSDFRWLDTYTVDDKGKIFNIADFIKCFQQTFEEIGYTGDAKNIGRAGVVRLNSLVNLFDNYHSIPIEDLLQKPTIIELAAIENSDQKALIISLLLLSILAYVNANYVGEGGLKNVIMLEEAHVLLDSDSNKCEGEANPSAIAQGLVKRMLAEIRSYGVGLVIADQSPRKVSTDVVALTDMKMVFRLVESADKQIIGDSTNMSEAQSQRMSKLKPGEAFLFFNKLDEPEEVITPDYRLENNISISLSDTGIKELTTYWNDKSDKLRPYPECHYCDNCKNSCDYYRRVLAKEVSRRIFVKNFKATDSEMTPIIKIFSHIEDLIKKELNDEEYNMELLRCVKVQLWRKIKYNTKIKILETQVQNSIKK